MIPHAGNYVSKDTEQTLKKIFFQQYIYSNFFVTHFDDLYSLTKSRSFLGINFTLVNPGLKGLEVN